MYNYTPQVTHPAKFDFDPTTWVDWANSQFATVFGCIFFLPVTVRQVWYSQMLLTTK